MKLNRSILLVAAMVGSMAAVGCSKAADPSSDAVAPEETVSGAPVQGDGAQAADSLTLGVHFYAPVAPPAIRVEEQGHPPSDRHFWTPGYYHWNGHEHVWNGGRWELRRDGYDYLGPRWERAGARWEYHPGYWHHR